MPPTPFDLLYIFLYNKAIKNPLEIETFSRVVPVFYSSKNKLYDILNPRPVHEVIIEAN